jgi:hypothetical protein
MHAGLQSHMHHDVSICCRSLQTTSLMVLYSTRVRQKNSHVSLIQDNSVAMPPQLHKHGSRKTHKVFRRNACLKNVHSTHMTSYSVPFLLMMLQRTLEHTYVHTCIHTLVRILHISKVGQNHVYTVCTRYFGQGNHQIYGQIYYGVCSTYTALANCMHT